MRVLPSQVQQAVTSEEPEELQNQEAKQMEAQVHELPDRPKQPVLEQLEPEVPRSSQKGPAKDSDVASSLTAAGRRPRRFSGAWIQTELEEGEKAPCVILYYLILYYIILYYIVLYIILYYNIYYIILYYIEYIIV